MSTFRLVRRSLAGLQAYGDEPTGAINLSNNSNVFPPNPAISRALREADPRNLAGYPSLDSRDLKSAISKRYGLPPESVVTGNGSNDLIDCIIRTFTEPGERVVYHPPTFEMIEVFARANLAEPHPVPLADDFSLDVDRMESARGKVTFILRPNNPTGRAFPARECIDLVKRLDGVVVIDEAYIEFASEPMLELCRERDNVIVLRTFSKAFGLAGLRVGWGAASPPIIAELEKVRGPFKLNALSESAARIALEDGLYVDGVVAEVRRQREILMDRLPELGIEPSPSDANFVLMRPPIEAHAFAAGMLSRGIAVRKFNGDLRAYVRATVGPAEVTAMFLEAARETIKEVAG